MAGKVKKEKDIVRPVRWQDVELCDRCGGRAQFRATAPSKSTILFCGKHKDKHEDALEGQKFSVVELTQP
jgi:hypothetical protein